MTSSESLNLAARIEHWPIAGSFTISRGAKTEAVTVMAEVSRGGHTGRGEGVPYPRYGETPEASLAALLSMQAALARGLDRQALQAAMPPGAARNALDCALLDLEAKAGGQRIWDLLGRPAPRACITAYTISLASPEAMAAATAKAAHRPLLKIKLGGDGDGRRITAVRKAAPESELIVDANEAWTAHNLEQNLSECAEAGVTLVEHPLPADQDEAHSSKSHVESTESSDIDDRSNIKVHNRNISVVSGYSTSDPTPEILEAEPAEYFRPMLSPVKSARSPASQPTSPSKSLFFSEDGNSEETHSIQDCITTLGGLEPTGETHEAPTVAWIPIGTCEHVAQRGILLVRARRIDDIRRARA